MYLTKLILTIIILASSLRLYATDIWLPLTLSIPNTETIAQNIPIPFTRSGGEAWGNDYLPGFVPGVSVGFNQLKRVYAIEDQKDTGQNFKDLKNLSGSEIFLHPNNPKGYRVIFQNNKSLSLAGGASVGPGGFLCLKAGIKLGLSYSKSFTFEKTVKTFKEANQVGSIINPSIPLDPESINKTLNVGDEISYKTEGGVFVELFASTGIILKAGLSASIKSNWGVNLKRLPNHQTNNDKVPFMSLTYTRGKGKDIGVKLGNLIASIEKSKVWESTKSIQLYFDLGNEKTLSEGEKTIILTKDDPRLKKVLKDKSLKGFLKENNSKILRDNSGSYSIDLAGMNSQKAYQLALQGDLSAAMLIADKNMTYGVKIVNKQINLRKATKKNVSFTIPIIYSNVLQKERSFVFNDMTRVSDNVDIYTYSGIISKTNLSSGLLSSDILRTKLFTTVVSLENDILKNEIPNPEISAQMLFSAVRNNVKPKHVITELENLKDLFGYKKLIDPIIEKVKNISARTNVNVKTFNVQMDIVFSELALENIVDILIDPNQDFIEESHNYVDGFVNKYKSVDYETGDFFNPDEKTNKLKYTSVAKKVVCKNLVAPTLNLCVKRLKQKIKNIVSDAISIAKKLDSERAGLTDVKTSEYVANFKDNDAYSKFVSRSTKIGYLLGNNRFILKTLLRRLKYSCSGIKYKRILDSGNPNIKSMCPEKTIVVNNKKIKIPFIVKLTFVSSQLPETKQILYGKEFIQ